MSNKEGLTMMDANINILEDLKQFNQKYHKYIKCSDNTLSDDAKSGCTSEDSNMNTINDAYAKIIGDNGTLTKLQTAPLNNFSNVTEYETKYNLSLIHI